MDEILQVITETINGVPVVHAVGEIDVSSAPLLRDQLAAIPESQPTLVVDLTGVTFLDSTGIGVLVVAQNRSQQTNGKGTLRLVVVHPHITKVLEVTGLIAVFSIFSTVDEALAA